MTSETKTRTRDDIRLDYDLMAAAYRIREWVTFLAKDMLSMRIDPSVAFGCTMDGLVLMVKSGQPMMLGTPQGQLACAFPRDSLSAIKIAHPDQVEWLTTATEVLGLERIEVTNPFAGENDSVWMYSVTRDLNGRTLPKAVWKPSRKRTGAPGARVPSIVTDDLWSSDGFSDIMEALSFADRVSVDQDAIGEIMSRGLEWSDPRLLREVGMLCKRAIWEEMRKKLEDSELLQTRTEFSKIPVFNTKYFKFAI